MPQRYSLGDGERELLKEVVHGSRGGKQVPLSKLIVTDRRLVLLVPKPDGVSKLLGRFIGALAKAAENLELVAQIRRNEFAAVEEPHPGMLVFRSDGDGYARTSFEVYGASSLAVWEERTRAWVAGDEAALVASGGVLS